MAGNTFGSVFRVSTFGESHGPAVGCILDGCPAGIPLDEAVIQRELDRRRVGRLYQFIAELNNLDLPASAALDHPGERRVQPIGRR